MPLGENDFVFRNNISCCATPSFRIKYKFNPPDDEKEEDEAEKYAVSKLKESLLATSRTSKLNNL